MCGKTHQRGIRAFTLTDMSVAIAVSGIILTALVSFTVYAAKSFAAMQNYVDLEQKSQNALDTMTRDIRETQRLTDFSTATVNGRTVTNSVTFLDYDDQPLTFAYNNNALVRRKAGTETKLLANVDYLTFMMFKRNTKPGTYDQFDLTDAANCKLISVSWICSRSILGSKINTESVQTAKIVIRKQ